VVGRQTISDIKAAVGLGDDGAAFPADPGIDDAEEYRAGGKPFGVGGEQIGRGFGLAARRVGKQLNDRHTRRRLLQHCVDLAGIGTGKAEIGKQDDHRRTMPPRSPAPQAGQSEQRVRTLR